MTEAQISNYKKALVEVEAVIKSLKNSEYKKIPQNLIYAINENKDRNYIYEYNVWLDYEYWNLMPETKAILYNILKKYLANDKQKQYFEQKERIELMQIEKEKMKKYNPDNIFKNKK